MDGKLEDIYPEYFPELQILDVSSNPKLKSSFFRTLPTHCKKLKALYCDEAPKGSFTPPTLDALLRHTELQALHMDRSLSSLGPPTQKLTASFMTDQSTSSRPSLPEGSFGRR